MYTAKVYKVCNTQDNEIYIGSTKQRLNQRFSGHRGSAYRNSQLKVHKHMRDLGVEKFYILELDSKLVSSRLEQVKLEREWQDGLLLVCLDDRLRFRPFRTGGGDTRRPGKAWRPSLKGRPPPKGEPPGAPRPRP